MHRLSLGSINLTSLVQGSQRDVCAGDREGEEEEEKGGGGEKGGGEDYISHDALQPTQTSNWAGVGVLRLPLVRWQQLHRSQP